MIKNLELIWQISECNPFDMLTFIDSLENPSDIEDVFEFKKDDKIILKHIAANVNTPIQILETLSKELEEEILIQIVKNKNTSESILNSLSNCVYTDIRCEIAERTADENTQRILAKDRNPSVRRSLLRNLNISLEILEDLCDDSYYNIRMCAFDVLSIVQNDKKAEIN